MMERIGVTGGTGFIGRYLLRDYADQYDFIVTTSQRNPANTVPGVEYRYSDFTVQSFRSIFSGCSAVIHLGASIPESVTALDSIERYWSSIASTEALLGAMAANQIKRLVFLSSVSVYGKGEAMPLRETYPYNPDNAYGIAKASIEMMLHLYEKQYGIKAAVLRVSQVLGYKEYKTKGFFSVLQDASRNHYAIPIYGEGRASRDYIYVKDVSRAIICALRSKDLAGVYNIGSGKPTTNMELAEAYCAAFENPAGIKKVHVDQEDSRYWYMDISKAERVLGFRPQYDLDSMVRDIKREMEHQRTPIY